ncbi:hypothetical protein EC988_004554 [Linderina pennispora]|nr:hypothetical protein EC988_004554 [Linderina pennispora]
MSTQDSLSYTLRYFDVQGLCETTRLILDLKGIEWTEEHPEWPMAKADQPVGRMPVLLEKNSDGEVVFELTESMVIERYLAHKYGLLPTDLQASARQEQLRDQFKDIWTTSIVYHLADDEDRKAKLKEKYDELATYVVKFHSKALQENGNSGHYVGDSISYIDIALYAFLKFIRTQSKAKNDDFSSYYEPDKVPEFAKVVAAVEAEPALERYFAQETKNVTIMW